MGDLIGARLGEGRGRTVADYLRAEEMEERRAGEFVEGGADGFATFQCMTPGDMVAGWMRKLRRRRKSGADGGGGRLQAKCLTKCFTEETSTCLNLVDEDEAPKDSGAGGGQEGMMASFKLGAGLGLVLVVAAGKNELDKMIELRRQMEMIVENAKEELRHKAAAACDSSQSRNNQTCSTTHIEESMNSNGLVSDPSCLASPYIEIDDKEWNDGRCDKGRCELRGMAQLESELEAELQLLELQLDSEDSSRENQEPSDSGSESATYEEEVEHGDEPMDAFTEAQYGGVPPLELERRLHELLESQQQERIKELETALRRTKHKLKKKEVEVCWWRDTAHLISRHVSQTALNYAPFQKDQTDENC
uniref:Protein POLAR LOCALIZATION DURING ASYMMETRIC DIVISION AND REDISTRIBUTION n=1 Tax=Kalanchoe fedtschenkoi TaxID=63787 RepID=A0A7N0U8D9_KALFE